MTNQTRVNKLLIYQSDRFDVFELDIGDSLEASGFVADDETNVADFADRREELLDVSCAAPVR